MTASNAGSARAGRAHWAWYVSALVYRWTSTGPSRAIDRVIADRFGSIIRGGRVLDCGCGPGALAVQLVAWGAAEVIAVDANPVMVAQAERNLDAARVAGRAEVRCELVDDDFFARLAEEERSAFDLIVFKRSLYAAPTQAIATVTGAVELLSDAGVMVVAHPERRLRRYALLDRRPWIAGHTLYHFANRLLSVVAARLGISRYRALTTDELVELLTAAVPAGTVSPVESAQQAYNVVAVEPATSVS